MDPKMPKLPAYVFRRQNGSYRYKRNVPKQLRHLIGKDTLYRQLGESYSEAMNALSKVHLEIEQLFAAEEMMPDNERALAFIRAALGEEVAEPFKFSNFQTGPKLAQKLQSQSFFFVRHPRLAAL